jgi:hypothetical protein
VLWARAGQGRYGAWFKYLQSHPPSPRPSFWPICWKRSKAEDVTSQRRRARRTIKCDVLRRESRVAGRPCTKFSRAGMCCEMMTLMAAEGNPGFGPATCPGFPPTTHPSSDWRCAVATVLQRTSCCFVLRWAGTAALSRAVGPPLPLCGMGWENERSLWKYRLSWDSDEAVKPPIGARGFRTGSLRASFL